MAARSTLHRARWLLAFLAGAAMCGLAPGTQAQEVTEPALKAAYLYNFAKFTEWPADTLAADAPLVFCVADTPVAESLERIVAGRSIGRHTLTVQRVTPGDPLLGCHVLYASDLDALQEADYLAATRGASILSISNGERFTALGGVARFFVENARLRFAINVKAADRARLRISSRLLALAKIVR